MVEKFRIAAYTRISVDLELDRDNTSIENQKAIIGEYCRLHFPTSTVDYFEDRDKSGYTFEQRPDYMRMREKLMRREYDILIIKDLSRFSRRTGKGLAEFEDLAERDIRIIAIGDGVDYDQEHIDDWMKIKLYFFVNEMPVTDTSRKVSDVIASRQSRGEWICSVPFGYVITNSKKMTFEIDEPSAEVVRRIFAYYIDGWGYKKIANHLTDEHIPTPRMREKARKEAQGDEYKGKVKEAWSVVTISEILCNDFYIGTLRQHKFKRKKINGSDVPLDENQHIVFENHHEPIIDYRTFAIAQELLKQRSTTHYRGQKKYANNYSGYLFCGDCGSPMFSRSRPDLADAYICGTYHTRGKAGCTTHHIRVDVLDRELKRYIAKVCENSEKMIKQLEAEIRVEPSAVKDSAKATEELAKLIEQEKDSLKILMRQKSRDLARAGGNEDVIMETYDALIEECANRIHGLENQIAMTADTRNTIIRANRHAKTVLEIFHDILSKEKLDKRDIGLIVDRIIVYENRIEIKLRNDVDALLRCDDEVQTEQSANFNEDTENIEKAAEKYQSVAVQSAKNQADKIFRVNVISGGDVFFIPINLPYQSYWYGDDEIEFLSYGFSNIEAKENLNFNLQVIECDGELKNQIIKIPTEGSRLSCETISLFYGALSKTIPYLRQNQRVSKKDDIVERAKKYIKSNTDCSVAEAAQSCFISEPYLYLLFKENVGCTPNDYRLKAKCKKGIEYLLTTDKTVEEISALIGLSSASHFRRILKSQMGLTPKEVRKRSDF